MPVCSVCVYTVYRVCVCVSWVWLCGACVCVCVQCVCVSVCWPSSVIFKYANHTFQERYTGGKCDNILEIRFD